MAVNIDKIKYMEVEHFRGMMANKHITIGSNSYEKLKTIKSFKSLSMNQNSIHGKIKCRLKGRNSCHYSALIYLSSRLLSKKLKTKVYKAITFPIVLYSCETWYFSSRCI